MKFNLRHVIAFFLLIVVSIGFGIGFDAVATLVEQRDHPRPETLQDTIQSNAREFGIPESVIWATVKTGSDFASNAVSPTGEIGLMQISPERFAFICTELLGEEEKDTGMLYDPATNLRAGCAWLSYLYNRYGVWDHVFAAYRLGPETVDGYLKDPNNLSEQGVLKKIPDTNTAAYVKNVKKAVDHYSELYYQA